MKNTLKYTFRGVAVDFSQPNQKEGQNQSKEDWMAARLQAGVWSDVNASDDDKRKALGEVWNHWAEPAKVETTPPANTKPPKNTEQPK